MLALTVVMSTRGPDRLYHLWARRFLPPPPPPLFNRDFRADAVLRADVSPGSGLGEVPTRGTRGASPGLDIPALWLPVGGRISFSHIIGRE